MPSWYLAVDMQLYVVCVITGYIMSKSRKVGYVVLGLLLGAALVIPGVVTYYHGLDATLRFYIKWVQPFVNTTIYFP